ncbi:MAG: response regulator [Chloroflexi bacterium]|nr:response regulator [Chloroflexota bacterium]
MKIAWHIDDDQEMIQAIAMMLKLLDIEVRPFYNAPAASKALNEGGRPDLLLLDINMPQVSGIDMLEFVRRKSEYAYLPIIMLSSEDTDTQVQEALTKGADAYIMKPVTLDELEKAIRLAYESRSIS